LIAAARAPILVAGAVLYFERHWNRFQRWIERRVEPVPPAPARPGNPTAQPNSE
jgi:hypothetical protein